MTSTITEGGGSAVPQNLVGRALGVVTAPWATFRRLIQAPRVLDMLALTSLLVALCLFLFLNTEVGRQAWVDESVRQQENWGGQPVSDADYERMQQWARYAQYVGAVQGLVGVPLVTLVLSGILFAVFNGIMGGSASFKQLFSVVTHAGVVSTLGQLFIWPLNYARGSMSSATNLGVFFPMLEEDSFAARMLGTVDLFVLWWLFVLAVGLGVLYRRKPRAVFTAFLAVYPMIAIGIAAILSG